MIFPVLDSAASQNWMKTAIKKLGLKKIIALQDATVTNKEAMNNAAGLLKEKAKTIFNFL